MKKWLIILFIIFGMGFISTAVLAGRVYYQDLKIYTDYDKKELESAALKNIYIKSSIPIEIYPTTGTPYVEFNQTFTDLMGAAPEYELNVDIKGESTYIDVNIIKDTFIWLGVKESTAQLSIYLPQSTINRLNIEDQNYYSYSRRDKQVINLEGINVNELDVSMSTGEFILDGNYGKINISSRGKITLNSKSPAQVYINQTMNQYLSGQFEKINITNNHGGNIVVDSTLPCQINMDIYNGEIDLKGNYSKVKINGEGNNIDLRSDTISQLFTEGYYNTIIANGPFENLDFNENRSKIEIKSTITPNKFSMGRESEGNDVSLTLPSNIPGFKVKYLSNYATSADDFDYYLENVFNSRNLQSDFELVKGKTSDNELVYSYGDGSLAITLEINDDNTLEIIDGGYSSSTVE